jgi:hypothetical protein
LTDDEGVADADNCDRSSGVRAALGVCDRVTATGRIGTTSGRCDGCHSCDASLNGRTDPHPGIGSEVQRAGITGRCVDRQRRKCGKHPVGNGGRCGRRWGGATCRESIDAAKRGTVFGG